MSPQGGGELLQVAKVVLPVLLRLRLSAGPKANSPGCVSTKQEVIFAEPEGDIYNYGFKRSILATDSNLDLQNIQLKNLKNSVVRGPLLSNVRVAQKLFLA